MPPLGRDAKISARSHAVGMCRECACALNKSQGLRATFLWALSDAFVGRSQSSNKRPECVLAQSNSCGRSTGLLPFPLEQRSPLPAFSGSFMSKPLAHSRCLTNVGKYTGSVSKSQQNEHGPQPLYRSGAPAFQPQALIFVRVQATMRAHCHSMNI